MGDLALDHVVEAMDYARRVVAGDIMACKWVKAACQRQLDDLARAESDPDYPFVFDAARAGRVIKFIELLRHVKGKWAGQRLVLHASQKFSLACVFGWVRKADGLRRFRTVYEEEPRKNAKTTKLAAVGLYMLVADDEFGAEVYSAATTRDQARIVWRIAKRMAAMDGLFRVRFGVDVLAHSIYLPHDDSTFASLSAEGSTLDGLNISCALIDELHAHKTRDVYDVLNSGTGSRLQPLIWAITTAGSNRAGVCFEQRTYVTRILNATLRRHGGMGYKIEGDAIEDESTWGIIYSIDEGDNPFDPAVWAKANPLYGVSVIPEDMQRLATAAAASVANLHGFLTKRLNVWVNADAAWMDMGKWDACADPTSRREAFAGEMAWIALDAAFIKDFFAKIVIVRRGKKYHAWGRYYAPEAALERKGWEQVRAWAAEGRITTTPGEVLDIEAPRADLLADLTAFAVAEVAYDPFQLAALSIEMIQAGVPMVEMRATVQNFSEPMKELDKLVAAGEFVHDGDPVLGWMVSNVVCHVDAKENIYPRKASRDAKIDGAVSLIMAIGRAMRSEGSEGDLGL